LVIELAQFRSTALVSVSDAVDLTVALIDCVLQLLRFILEVVDSLILNVLEGAGRGQRA